MNIYFKYCILLIISLLSTSKTFSQTYSRTKNYNRFHLSLADVKDMLKSISYYTDLGKSDSIKKAHSFSFNLDLINDNKSINYTSLKQIENISSWNDDYGEMDLRLSSDETISNVTIHFNQISRKISIEGSDEKKGDALYNDLDSQLKNKIGFLAFLNLNFIFTILIFLIAYFIAIFSANKLIELLKLKNPLYIVFGCSLLISLGLIPVAFSNMFDSTFFPQFSVSTFDVSWLDKNINLLGFISLLLTVAAFKPLKILYQTNKLFKF